MHVCITERPSKSRIHPPQWLTTGSTLSWRPQIFQISLNHVWPSLTIQPTCSRWDLIARERTELCSLTKLHILKEPHLGLFQQHIGLYLWGPQVYGKLYTRVIGHKFSNGSWEWTLKLNNPEMEAYMTWLRREVGLWVCWYRWILIWRVYLLMVWLTQISCSLWVTYPWSWQLSLCCPVWVNHKLRRHANNREHKHPWELESYRSID